MLSYYKLPNIMYFGSSEKHHELKGQFFLTPLIGVASLFIIDKDDLLPSGYRTSCNLGYKQWCYSNELLMEPLNWADISHNILEFKDKVFCGSSSGFIHVIDISKVKDKISLFVTNDPDREVIYKGEQLLDIIELIPHTIEWTLNFSQGEVEKYGVGTVERLR